MRCDLSKPIFLMLCSISMKLTALIVDSESARISCQIVGGAFMVIAIGYAVLAPGDKP